MTDEAPPEEPKRNPMAEEAAAWFARMRGPEAEAHRVAFDAWLARGALHRGAYNRAVEIFSDGKFLGGTNDADVRPENVLDSDDPPWRRRRVPLMPVVIAAICLIMIIGWAVVANPVRDELRLKSGAIASEKDVQSGELRFRTRPGEVRSEILADGSSVTLRPDSQLVVQFDKRHRDLRLERGRARFEVAHEVRPFVVYAGGGSVTARGTVFDVKLGTDRHVTVKLERGSVDVVLPDSSDRQAPFRRLSPGQVVTFDIVATTPIVDSVKTANLPAADQIGSATKLRTFDRVRLADLIEEANRGTTMPLRLQDATLGERTVSGQFQISDTAKLADRLATLFDLRVERSKGSEILLSRQPSGS